MTNIVVNHAALFAQARKSVFNGAPLTQGQVDGINAILRSLDKFNVNDPRQAAAVLATPMIETGGSFLPITESLNYSVTALLAKFPARITKSQANQYGRTASSKANQVAIGNTIYGGDWGKKNLGNVALSDGYAFRGRGLVQLTGRRLYALASTLVGKDYLANPDLAKDLSDAADILVVGMRDGIFTGRKLAHYFNASTTDFHNARRIVNGVDKASTYAAWGERWLSVLKAAGYGKAEATPEPVIEPPFVSPAIPEMPAIINTPVIVDKAAPQTYTLWDWLKSLFTR